MDIRQNFYYGDQDIVVHQVQINHEGNAFVVACDDGFRGISTANSFVRFR
jgi:hypothetical protein